MAHPAPQPAGPRRAIVTGGGAGIGRAICQRLGELGWAVVIADRDQSAAEQTARLLPATAPAPAVLPLDVADAGGWQQAISTLRGDWPRLDLLVNNAGTLHAGPVHQATAGDLVRVIETNLSGVVLGCQAAGPWLMESAAAGSPPGAGPRPGAINMASVFALLAPPSFATYSASKAGVAAFSEAIRGEWRPHGLNVTVALPGVAKTGLFATAGYTSPATGAAAQRYATTGRLSPVDVAASVLAAAEAGKASVVIGGRARRFATLKRLLPTLARRVVAAQIQRHLP